MCWISVWFAKGDKIMEYGPVATKAAQEQFHKENVWDFSMVLKGGKIMEYGPVAAKAAQEQFHKTGFP